MDCVMYVCYTKSKLSNNKQASQFKLEIIDKSNLYYVVNVFCLDL